MKKYYLLLSCMLPVSICIAQTPVTTSPLADTMSLQTVQVTASGNAVSLKLDKKVFEVGRDILSQTGSINDLLNNVPSVSVDPSGGISLRGNSQVLILVNGRRTGLTQGNVLEQIPANQVERVEVISNPSSKYEAAGSAGIINIILKKNKKSGVSGELRLVAGIPNETRVTPSISFKSDRLNLFGTVGIRLSDYVGKYSTDQFTQLSGSPVYLHQQQDEDRHDDGRLLYIGADYQLNIHQSVTAAFFKNATKDHDKSRLDYQYSGTTNDQDSTLSRFAESHEKRSYNQLEFNYSSSFAKPGKKLTVDMQYDFWNSDKNWNLDTQKDYPQSAKLATIRTNSDGTSKDIAIQSDMLIPVDSNATFEFGIKAEQRRVVTAFIAEMQDGAAWNVIDDIDNKLSYRETIGSAYAQWSSKIGHTGYQLGLRSELTGVQSRDRVGTYNNSKRYLRIFPTLHISYPFSSSAAMQASYSRRINRPSLDLVFPFTELTDLNTRYVGNPDINPSYADVLEIGFLKTWKTFTINPSIYYQRTRDMIEEYTYRNDDGLFITSPVNIDHESRTGVELSVTHRPFKWLQVNAELNAWRFRQEGFYKQQDIGYAGNTITGRISAQAKFKQSFTAQVTYNIRGANATAQTINAAVHGINAGLGKSFLKNKTTLLFDVNNLFALRKFRTTTTASDYKFTQTIMPNAARYRLTFVYRMKQKENEAVRQAKQSNRD